MRPATSIPLADAFLALSDADADAAPDRRTLPRMVAAAISAAVLAVGVPLTWYMAPRAPHPVAALSSKTAPADIDE